MLEEIRIKDLGVIADTVLELGSGFTAITGETGAGKTMVITALSLLMGNRSDSALVRSGSDSTRVAGALQLAPEYLQAVAEIVTDAGGELEDAQLLISRTVNSDGASRASVGGVRAPAAVLKQLAQQLFCVHGQTDQLRLKSAAQQRETLDRFAGSELTLQLQKYQEAYQLSRKLAAEITEITENRQARAREIERLEVETAEIIAADPQPAEITHLQTQIAQLENCAELREAIALAANALAGSESEYGADAQTLVARALSAVSAAADNDPQLEVAAEALQTAAEALRTATGVVVSRAADLDADVAEQLSQAQSRLAVLYTLCRKYGPELDDVIAYLHSASARLLELGDDDTRLTELTGQLADVQQQRDAAAARLTALRTAAAAKLGAAVTAEFSALALPESELLISITPTQPHSYGVDEIAFLLRPHPQATPRSLAKSASGGELSRIMLALEVVLAGADPVPTFVFDEIDAGIGGEAAIEVGKRLAQLARTSQVIVVTHLAQVAAFADNHVRVVKDSSGGYTESSCVRLTHQERLSEIARLLSGLSTSESALAHAAELLEKGANSGKA